MVGFFSASVLKIAVVNIIGGAIFGFAIAFVPIHTTFTTINQNCTLYESQGSCGNVFGTTCSWDAANRTCNFLGADCSVGMSDSSCTAISSDCLWSYTDKVCRHAAGYTSVQSGIFSGAMIVGGLFGSLVTGSIVSRIGRKKSMLIIGIISLIASILVHISSATNTYGLMIAARLILGVAMGGMCIVGPMYVEEMVPEEHSKPVGVLFQVFCTFGIVLAAAIGLALNPTDFTVEDVNMKARFQGFDAFMTVLSLLVVLVGATMEESRKWRPLDQEDHSEDVQLVKVQEAAQEHYTVQQMIRPLVIAFFLSLAQQMTGINAIMNYAPNITANMNLKPLTGNFVVMAWNFITTLVAIPLSSRFSMRQMFLTGTIVASLACLCTGIPVYPGVTNDTTRSALAGVGIGIFIAAFELGMGPCFYVLAQILFPESFRPKGSSFTMVVQFLFNIIINICFPIAVESLSGGPAGDQNKGMGIAFMFFGCCGVLSWLVLVKELQPFTKKDEPHDE